MTDWVDKKILGTLCLAILLAVTLFYGIQYVQQQLAVVPAVDLYTDDLTVWFKVMDDTGGVLVSADIIPKFYSVGTNPFERTFIGTADRIATYDSTENEWSTVIDAGSYILLVSKNESLYPIKETITVPGTNETEQEVKLSPYMLHLKQRATPTITNSIFAYNDTTEAYDITGETGFNTTAFTKWMVEYRVSVAGTQMVLKPGRIYMTELSNFAVTKAYIDSVQVSVGVDRDSTDDGQIGYYASYAAEWRTGTHYVQIYLQSTDTPSGNFKLTLVDYYACVNDDLIWYTYEYATLSTQT